MPIARILRFSKPGLGSVNTFAIDLADSIILIDGQRELSSAREALANLNPLGKPISAVFLTHPHPDHVGGIGVFVDAGEGCPLYASQATRDGISSDRMGFIEKTREAAGDDFPESLALPDHVLSPGESVTLGGLTIETQEMGAGEAACMTVLYLPDSGDLFAADIVQNRMTAFLLEGRLDAWLDQIEALRGRFPDVGTVHPGHGASGSPDTLLAYQRNYLMTFRSLVAEEMSHGKLSHGAETRIASRMQQSYPNFDPVAAIPDLLDLDIAAIAGEISKGHQP